MGTNGPTYVWSPSDSTATRIWVDGEEYYTVLTSGTDATDTIIGTWGSLGPSQPAPKPNLKEKLDRLFQDAEAILGGLDLLNTSENNFGKVKDSD